MQRTRAGRLRRDAAPEATPRPLWAPRYWPTWLLLGLGRLIAPLPYPVLLGLGRALGSVDFLIARKRWRRASAQLRSCFPQLSQAQQRRLVLRNAQSYGIGVMERLIGWWWPPRRIRRLLKSISGLEDLRRAQGEGRGVILLALHTTTMDIGATLLRLTQQTDFTYQPASNPVIDWVQRRGRSRPEIAPQGTAAASITAIPSASTRSMIRQLQAGHVVWYAPDRDFGSAKSHVFAPLFGKPAATITATSRYARLTGARVVTLEYWRDAGGGYRLRFGEALANFPGSSDTDDCTRINAWIESVVRRHPEQYRWTHRRFRTRPPAPGAGDNGLRRLNDSAVPAANAAGAAATSRATAA
jgi:KDO2-lipid IV(A) lauroyltransferase